MRCIFLFIIFEMYRLIWLYIANLFFFLGVWLFSGSLVHITRDPKLYGTIWVVGLLLFLIWSYIKLQVEYKGQNLSLITILRVMVASCAFALGVGVVSGGIQHFWEVWTLWPWYIALWLPLSLLAFWPKEQLMLSRKQRKMLIVTAIGLWCLLYFLSRNVLHMFPVSSGDDHHAENNSHLPHEHHNDIDSVKKTRADFSNDEKFAIHMCLMGDKDQKCVAILDPMNTNTYGDAIQEQCELMAGMEACARYFWTTSWAVALGEQYDLSANTAYLDKKTQEIVQLTSGDSYALRLENINATIGWKQIRMMAYNWSIPGPLIKVTQWSNITLKVTNNIADIMSTVHHHGLRLKDRYDGVPQSMGWFDIPMKKWDSIEYKLDFPDAGVFRYHPHVREDLQQELWLYGNYVVVPKDTTYRNAVDDEQLLILDDIQLDDKGVAPFWKEQTNQAIMGRFGTHYLLNWSEEYTLQLTQGKVTRLYVTNAANVRPFNITIPGVSMKLVGSDIGAYEQETMIDSLLIAPAERYVIELYAKDAWTFDLQYKNPAFTKTLWKVVVAPNATSSDAGKKFSSLRTVSQVVNDIDAYRKYFDQPVDKKLRLDMTLNGKTKHDMSLKMKHAHDGSVAKLWGLSYDLSKLEWLDEMFAMNSTSTDETTKWQLIDEATNKVSMDIDDWYFTQWSIVKVRITNDGEWLHPMQHPIHFHGQRFLVLNKNWVQNDNLVWKDTVLTLPGEYVDILIDMSNPGSWMAHCHIAEHMHAGMMMHFEVWAKGTKQDKEQMPHGH